MEERIFAVAGYADRGVLLLLVGLALFSLLLILERWRRLKPVVDASLKFRQQLRAAVRERNLGVVHQIAGSEASIEGRAVRWALSEIQAGRREGLEEMFASVANLEKAELERSLGFLATVGANAPYIGLFGTVLGIMKAFHDMANAAGGNQQSIMAGISAALIATAAGLLVAIPAVLAFNYFQRQVKVVLSSLDTCRDLVVAYSRHQGGEHGRQG